jgi:hypothetical protein
MCLSHLRCVIAESIKSSHSAKPSDRAQNMTTQPRAPPPQTCKSCARSAVRCQISCPRTGAMEHSDESKLISQRPTASDGGCFGSRYPARDAGDELLIAHATSKNEISDKVHLKLADTLCHICSRVCVHA